MSAAANKKGARDQKSSLTKELVLKDYKLRVRDNIRSFTDNFAEIVRLAKIEDTTDAQGRSLQPQQIYRTTSYEQEDYEMQVRAANMGRAAEALLKLVSDLKQFLVLHDFGFVNDTIARASKVCEDDKKLSELKLARIHSEINSNLAEIEQELTDKRTESALPALRS